MGNPVYTSVPAEQGADPVTELALDLRWSWNHSTDELWRELEPELWEATQNPWMILQAVSHRKLQKLLSDHRFRKRVDSLLETKRNLEAAGAWYQAQHGGCPLTGVAFFSMEFMLSEALPIYSGGLGNVAGDHLKTASDLGVPVIGIGLLYQQGYFRQEIDADGSQIARYPFNEPGQLPVRPLRTAEGDWLRLRISFRGYTVWLRAWEAHVGRRRLYLLDSNDPVNLPAHRCITSELYGGGQEMRLRQEIVLGIGGWRLLRALGLQPEVCHMNEGHSALAAIERAKSFMEDHNQSFEAALTVTRSGNLFTTHTPVAAGFDRFPAELMEKYFRRYAEERLKLQWRDFLGFGRANPQDDTEPFNMAYLGIRTSTAVNGVSRLHGAVSRRLFQSLFPRWPEAEVPVSHVTNGVHVPTWDSAEADALWESACGRERWRGSLGSVSEQLRCVGDSELWEMRTRTRKALVDFTRKRLAQQLTYQGAPEQEIEDARNIFDGNHLTIGFARRFAEYKRPTMLLHDPERLVRILTNSETPVQLVLAGKAHPQDGVGRDMIKQWSDFLRRHEVRGRAVFLADYNMLLTHHLVEGVDVWVNTPRRPWEACGTSGMKILANGGLNVSELDGWWAEAYAPEVGWAIGNGVDRGKDPAWDAAEADQLYTLLEQEIIPAFYERDSQGLPRRWIARMRESMARLTPAFSSNRSVRQYTEEHYLPAASRYCERSADGGRAGADLLAWQSRVASDWPDLHFRRLEIENCGDRHLIRVEVHLGRIQPEDVRIEVYADSLDGGNPLRDELRLVRAIPESSGAFLYAGTVAADRPAQDYTPRAIPRREGLLIPIELPLIAWAESGARELPCREDLKGALIASH